MVLNVVNNLNAADPEPESDQEFMDFRFKSSTKSGESSNKNYVSKLFSNRAYKCH
jgi:hypothetical protein